MGTLKNDWTDWNGTGSPTPGVNQIPAATFNLIPTEVNRSPRVVLFNGTTWPARSTASTVTFFIGGTTSPTDMIDGDVWLPIADDTVSTDATQTLTNKTLTNPKVNAIKDTSGSSTIDFAATGSAVNYLRIVNAATGNGPGIEAVGTNTDIPLNLTTKGTGDFTVNNAAGSLLFKIDPVASAVNYPFCANSATGSNVVIGAWGTDTNVSLDLQSKGTGVVKVNGTDITTISGTRNVTAMPAVVRVAAEAGLTYTIASGTVTTINGTTIDGITVAVGDRIVIVGAPAATGAGANSTNQPGNGIYIVTAVATNISVARSTDMSGTAMPYGSQVYVRDGASWGGWSLYFDRGSGQNTFTWGTTALQYVNWTNANSLAITDGTQTLTNKRINPRITTINAPGATPTVATGNFDQINYTGMAAAITSMTTGITGTPVDGQRLMLRFKDNGTIRAIAWGTSYVSSGIATLLATTAANKTHLVELLYDSAVAKWVCVRVDATGY